MATTTVSTSATGKRKQVEEDDEAFKARLRSEGWTFSSDVPKPDNEPPVSTEDLVGAVIQSGALAAKTVLAVLRSSSVAAVALVQHVRS